MSDKAGPIARKTVEKKEADNCLNQRENRSQHCCPEFDRTLSMQRNLGNRTMQRMVESGAIQAKLKIGQSGPHAPASVVPGPGISMPDSIRSDFEKRFGHDFSHVRIHTNNHAADAADVLNARAYTYGQNVVFGQGQYEPGTTPGRKLLVHELAHVVQNKGPQPGPVIKRYEGYEHIDFGDEYLTELLAYLQTPEGEKWAADLGLDRDQLVSDIESDPIKKQSPGSSVSSPVIENPASGEDKWQQLTPGQIIALMGDFYGSWENLRDAPKSEVENILKVMEQERAGTIEGSKATEEYEKYTGGRYLQLASQNDDHFFRENKQKWLQLHEEAITLAKTAAENNSETQFREALLIDAAAGHFLTDAFSSGHLFDKKELMTAIQLHIYSNPPIADNPAMQSYFALIDASGNMPNLVVKNIHDRMNREGFQIENGKGMKWMTYGDAYLKSAPETQRIGALALFLSRQQIIKAYGGKDPDPKEVEMYMPNDDTVKRATTQAISYIPQAMKDVESLIYQNRTLAPLQFGSILGSIIESNLSAVAHPGREAEVTRMLESAERMGLTGGVLVPSFTLVEWK